MRISRGAAQFLGVEATTRGWLADRPILGIYLLALVAPFGSAGLSVLLG